MVKRKFILVLFLTLAFSAAGAFAGTVKVSQETAPESGIYVDLGFIDAYPTGLTTAGFYSYNNPSDSSFNGPWPELTSNRSHLFFLQAADGLSVVSVHDIVQDDSGGELQQRFDLLSDPDGFQVLVKDDGDNADTYSIGPYQISTAHVWFNCCTDGIAAGSLDGNWCLLVQIDCSNIVGIDTWKAYSADNSTVDLDLTPGRRVKFCYIPSPSALVLGSLGIAFVSWLKKRRSL